MRKRLIAVFMVLALATLIAGCIEVSEIEYVEFDTYPKTTYLIGEELETFEVVYKLKSEASEETLSSDDDQVKKIGFSTDNPGTFTMRVYIEGYEDVSINFVYTVVNSMIDTLFAGGYGTEEEPYQIETPQQLSNIRLALDKHFVLNNDVNLDGIEWTPIGEITWEYIAEQSVEVTIVSGFSGTLNGQGHQISMSGSTGLFVALHGNSSEDRVVVRDLRLDLDIVAEGNGVPYGLADVIQYGLIDGLTVTGSITGRGGSPVAGWYAWNTIIQDSTNEADIYVPASVERTAAGNYIFAAGFAGQSFGVHFINVHNSGNITFEYRESGVEGKKDLGSMTGVFVAQHGSETIIEDSTNSGEIIGSAIGQYNFYGRTYVSENVLTQTPEVHNGTGDSFRNNGTVFVGNIHVGFLTIRVTGEDDVVINQT